MGLASLIPEVALPPSVFGATQSELTTPADSAAVDPEVNSASDTVEAQTTPEATTAPTRVLLHGGVYSSSFQRLIRVKPTW